MKSTKFFYSRFVLWLIRPALEAREVERKEAMHLRLVEQTHDIRKRVRSGELHL